jgi:hypothetical protein
MRLHLLLLTGALAACTPQTFVPGASPLSAGTPGPGLGAAAGAADVQIEARAEAWPGVPDYVAYWSTPLVITITNRSSVPLWIAPGTFALVAGGGTFRPFVPWSDDTKRAALQPGVLPPRSSVRGFVFFQRVAGRYGPIFVRADLHDADGARYATVDIPFLLKTL